MEERVISLEGVEKTYGNFTLGPVDLEIEPGYVVAVVGPNGSGKSTLFKTLMNLKALCSGSSPRPVPRGSIGEPETSGPPRSRLATPRRW